MFNVTCNDISVICDGTDAQADWRRSFTYVRAPIDISQGSLTCPSYTDTGPPLLYGDSNTPPHLVAFYDTLEIQRTYSRLNPNPPPPPARRPHGWIRRFWSYVYLFSMLYSLLVAPNMFFFSDTYIPHVYKIANPPILQSCNPPVSVLSFVNLTSQCISSNFIFQFRIQFPLF